MKIRCHLLSYMRIWRLCLICLDGLNEPPWTASLGALVVNLGMDKLNWADKYQCFVTTTVSLLACLQLKEVSAWGEADSGSSCLSGLNLNNPRSTVQSAGHMRPEKPPENNTAENMDAKWGARCTGVVFGVFINYTLVEGVTWIILISPSAPIPIKGGSIWWMKIEGKCLSPLRFTFMESGQHLLNSCYLFIRCWNLLMRGE